MLKKQRKADPKSSPITNLGDSELINATLGRLLIKINTNYFSYLK